MHRIPFLRKGIGSRAFERSSLGLNLDQAINCHPGVLQAERGINVCTVHRKDIKLKLKIPCSASTDVKGALVDVKDPMVSFAKSRQVIIGTRN